MPCACAPDDEPLLLPPTSMLQDRPPRRALLYLPLLLLAALVALPAQAQEAEPCAQGRISNVFIDNHSVFDLSNPDLNGRLEWAFRLANRLHIRTREDVIRRELLFGEGDCYDARMLEESERILRRSAFLARVDIFGVRQPDGSYHVVVDTQDDWSTRVEVQTEPGTGMRLTGVALREDNLLGTGQRLSTFYLRSFEHNVYGVAYQNPQLFATRWQAGFEAGRTSVGYLLGQSVLYPFVGETGRWAVRQDARHYDRYLEFLTTRDGQLSGVLFPERRRTVSIGGATRRGRPGGLTLLGAMVAGEWITYPGMPRYARGSGIEGDSVPLLPGMDSVTSVRPMVLAGRRNIYYVRRRGLDTVTGTEDVRLGLEIEIGFGRSIPALSTTDDLSLDFGIFTAAQLTEGLLAGTRLRAEAKRDHNAPPGAPEWRDVFTQFDTWAYLRPSPESRHLLVADFALTGGWHPRVPFQLTVGGATGLRGHPRHVDPGAQRAVLSLEHRAYLGWPLPQLFDLGSVAFVDVGRTWAGDAPFGVDSPLRANVGVGLRGALPPGSPSTWRVDLAAPIQTPFRAGGLVLSLGVGQVIGRALHEDPQLRRSSRRGISSALFTVPEQREP